MLLGLLGKTGMGTARLCHNPSRRLSLYASRRVAHRPPSFAATSTTTMPDDSATASCAPKPTPLAWRPTPPSETPEALTWQCGSGATAGRLDLRQPHQGIAFETGGSDLLRLLGVQLSPSQAAASSPVDGWVRAADAFGVYEPHDSRRLRVTAQWRLETPAAAVRAETCDTIAIELVLSAQTSRVTSAGTLAVDCQFTTTELLVGWWQDTQLRWAEGDPLESLRTTWNRLPPTAVCCLLCRGVVADQSLAVCLRRDEVRHVLAAALSPPVVAPGQPRSYRLTSWCFPTLIEKGVLHRSRLRATLGTSIADREWAAETAAAFAAEPPLLQ